MAEATADNYVQIGTSTITKVADGSSPSQNVSLSDTVLVIRKNSKGAVESVVNCTIQDIIDEFSDITTANSIVSVTAQESSADSGSNIVTIHIKDGSKYVFTVKNGSKGNPGPTGSSFILARTTYKQPLATLKQWAEMASDTYDYNWSTESIKVNDTVGFVVYDTTNNAYCMIVRPVTAINSSTNVVTSAGYLLAKGDKGDRGPSDIYVGSSAPTNPDYKVWVNPDGETSKIANIVYPVGSIYMSVSSTDPSILFGGTWVSIASGRVLMGVDASHGAGTTAEAGLPNITGTFVSGSWLAEEVTGAFYDTGTTLTRDNGTDARRVVGIDASLSSSVYGNSDTVQPPAFYVYIWRRTA